MTGIIVVSRYTERMSAMARSESPTAVPFTSDSPSFSVIYFAGGVHDKLPSLLTNCGYQIIEHIPYNGSFFDLLDQISRSPARTIVYKATYSLSSGAVLVDPEMIVGTVDDRPLQAFCTRHHTIARVAIWERFTKSVIARQISARGIDVDFQSISGATPRKPLNAPPDLVRWPEPDRLLEFLAAGGARTDQMFADVSAQVFKLDEAKMAPASH